MNSPEKSFRAKAYRRVTKTTPRPDAEAGPYLEPVEAADWAETWLSENGVPDESFVDLYFNGDPNIHTSIYLVMRGEQKVFGALNSSHAQWPLSYVAGDNGGIILDEEPFGRDTDEWLPGDSEEDENVDDAEEPVGNQDDGSEDDGDNDAEDEDDTDGNSDQDGDDGDGEEEPRMTIFGKFRGPKGWRKRAETDPEMDTNTFAVRFGVLDPERRTPAQQERNSRVEIRFTERSTRRDAGELRIRIPDGVRLRDEGKWLVAEIPYTDEEE